MSTNSNYLSTNRSKHYLKCHLIFVCKYRQDLLHGPLEKTMRSVLLNIAQRSDVDIELFESDQDHIHFLIRYIPPLSVSSIARRWKQESTLAIWEKHSGLLSSHFWRERTFWSDGYFVCSIGETAPETIRQYILSQG